MATSQTISGGAQFPEGTSVSAYPRSAWGVEAVTGTPSGAATDTKTVTGGALAFTGLANNTDYIAYAQVGGVDRYRRFSTRETASVGGLDQTTADSRYDPQYPPAVVVPQGNVEVASVSNPGTNVLLACRVVVPRTGSLRDLFVFVGTVSGNVRGAVYDVGATTNAIRTKIYDGASTPAAANWLSLGDPQIAVTAGQHLDLAVMADNVTATLGRRSVNGSATVLPANFAVVGGCVFKSCYSNSPGSFATPASLNEANAQAGTALMPVLIARVV